MHAVRTLYVQEGCRKHVEEKKNCKINNTQTIVDNFDGLLLFVKNKREEEKKCMKNFDNL